MKKSLLINIFLIFCFIFSISNSFAQVQDNAIDDTGDIAFVAYGTRSVGVSGFAFILLDNCPNNTTIYFTDEEWNGTNFVNLYNIGEGDLSWQNTTGATITKGTVIKVAGPINNISVVLWTSGNTSVNLGTINILTAGFNTADGDQVYAMTAPRPTSGSFMGTFLAFVGGIAITNLSFNNTPFGSGTAPSASLTAYGTNITVGKAYTGTAVCNGTAVQCNTMINTASSWTTTGNGTLPAFASLTTTAGFNAAIPSSFTGSVLPIELTSFEGKNNGNQNQLTWATASETQNNGFDIERSTDGSRFEKIGFVAGNGTTSQTQRYTFNDDKSPNGIAYYRLKQLDYDGRFEYSKIVAIAQKGDNAVSVFPNPSNGVFTLSGLENIEDEQISIVNSIGQNIAITVQNDGQMDLSAYPSGVYYLRIASSGQVMKLIHQ
jgi:hypothetical protein